MVGLDFGEKTSLVCNVCKKAILTGEKVYSPNNQSHIINHQSCRTVKK